METSVSSGTEPQLFSLVLILVTVNFLLLRKGYSTYRQRFIKLILTLTFYVCELFRIPHLELSELVFASNNDANLSGPYVETDDDFVFHFTKQFFLDHKYYSTIDSDSDT